jgi:hypothetical protein
MRQIVVQNRVGVFFKIDEEVAERIGNWSWSLNNKGYLQAHVPKSGTPGKVAILSRTVIWVKTGKWPTKDNIVRHINGDRLDGSFSNLCVTNKSRKLENGVENEKSQHGVDDSGGESAA